MKTKEMLLFRQWIRAEILANDSPIYQNKAKADALFKQLLAMCEDEKLEVKHGD